MIFSKRLSLIMILFLILISGCSNNNKETEKESKEANQINEQAETKDSKSELDYDKFAIKIDDSVEWMKVGPGEYYGENYDEKSVKAELDKLPSQLDAEEYFHRLLALTAEDFIKYQTFIEETEVVFAEISDKPGEIPKENEVESSGTLNVQILLDASGSMAAEVDGGVKMDLAKETISNFVSGLPEDANVSLRVYGHKGSNQKVDKEISCSQTEEIYKSRKYEEEEFEKALNKFDSTGYTPIAKAIEDAKADLVSASDEATKSVVYVVSDGEETCGGDPVAAAKELKAANIDAIVNIIGFDIEDSEREALEEIAAAGEGEYFNADTGKELSDTFKEEKKDLINEWREWVNENVEAFHSQEQDYVDEAHEYETEAIELSNIEENRLQKLLVYLEEQNEDIPAGEIRNLILQRSYNIRYYMKQSLYDIRHQAREGGYELRDKVRQEGHNEKEDLNK